MRWASAAALAVALAAARPAGAEPPADIAPPELGVDAAPLLGTGASIATGWNEIVVGVQNRGAQSARGRVEVVSKLYGRERRDFRATAPFTAGAGATVNVRVPAQVAPYGDLLVEVFDADGRPVARRSFSSFAPTGVSLLDVSEVPRLRNAVNEAVVAPLFTAGLSTSRGSAPMLSVVSPRFDPATGDPLLPSRSALYTTMDAVLVRSDVLVRLAGAEIDALAGYVLAGGTLAIAVARPEDVRHPTLAAFAGGAVSRQSVFAATLGEVYLQIPSKGVTSTSRLIPRASEPSGEVAETLAGYGGGNLHGSIYGSSAAYGLGEVHLLAFDPTRKPAVDDPWVEARMVDLARRAFDRRSAQVFRPGAGLDETSYHRVRQQLDPNESSRWAIGAAVLLLIAYAVVAGPVSFSLAARAGRPLEALRRLPILAAVAFLMVVGIGAVAKGVTGRARHLTLVEAGAGMSRGTARRFRGFYASHAKDLTVRTTDASSLVATPVADAAERRDHLVVDRDGARLVDVIALPWQTVVVREDGFASIGDGIALTKEGDRGVAVINRSGHDLRAAVLRAPSGEAYYFPRIKDGDRAVAGSGNAMSASADGRGWEHEITATPHRHGVALHGIEAPTLKAVVDEDAPGLAEAWWALADAAGDNVDWFPDGVPTLVGQLDGGEGRASDSGLRLESDRLLVRVVGYGGRP